MEELPARAHRLEDQILLAPLVTRIRGVDFSPEMIDRAAQSAPANADFKVQDVLELGPDSHGMFDVVMTIRCLINILDVEKQKLALENIRSVLKPGGRLIFIEGSAQGRTHLNALREQSGLAAMPPVWHNLDFDEDETLAFFQDKYDVVERISFGTYDFVSRIVHPLAVRPAEPDYQGVLNEVGARLALIRNDMPDISRVLGLVLRKR